MPQEQRDARPRCQYRRGRERTGLLWFFGIERGSVVEEFCEFVLSWGFCIEKSEWVMRFKHYLDRVRVDGELEALRWARGRLGDPTAK